MYYEIYNGIDAFNYRSGNKTGVINTNLVAICNNETIMQRKFDACKRAAEFESKHNKNYRDHRLFTYVVELTDKPLPRPEINGCMSFTIKAASYVNGELYDEI